MASARCGLWFGVQWVCNFAHSLPHSNAIWEEEQAGVASVTAKALAGAPGLAGGQQEGIMQAHKCLRANFVVRKDCATPVTTITPTRTESAHYYLGKRTCETVDGADQIWGLCPLIIAILLSVSTKAHLHGGKTNSLAEPLSQRDARKPSQPFIQTSGYKSFLLTLPCYRCL